MAIAQGRAGIGATNDGFFRCRAGKTASINHDLCGERSNGSCRRRFRVGPPTEVKLAGDPCRAIEIVALTGQLCATGRTRLIVTARATQKLS
jgi:hypothetical protein